MTIEAINRRGRPVEVTVTAAPLPYRQRDRSGAIIVMDLIGDPSPA